MNSVNLIVPSGTQIVLLNDVKVLNENRFQPRGAVGAIRWKHAMHLIRLLFQGIGILRESDLIVRVETNRQTLLSIKRGESDWRAVNESRLNLHKEFERAFAETSLPERPNYEKANEFLIKARRSSV